MADALVTCPACGFMSLSRGPGSDQTCAVCDWTDDFQQRVHPDVTYGANSGRTLRQVQQHVVAQHPPGERRAKGFERDPQWRPLQPGEVPVADDAGPASPVCYVAAPDPEQYVPYWLQARGARPRSDD